MPDIPSAAYQNTMRALDEFDAVASMYAALLDTQRALLRAKNPTAAERLSVRGDPLARQATAYGQQLSAMRTAITNAQYEGKRTREIHQRLRETERQAQSLSTSANQLVTLCMTERNAASTALDNDRGVSSHPSPASRARDGYSTARRGLVIDTSW